MFISPHYTEDHLDLENLSIEDRIAIFEDRIRGYYTTPARLLSNIYENSVMLVLLAVVSCVELIEIVHKGESSSNKSAKFFGDGMIRIFKPTPGKDVPKEKYAEDLQKILKDLYAQVRCGLMHTGTTGSRVILAKRQDRPILVDFNRAKNEVKTISINPYLCLHGLEMFLSEYCSALRNPKNTELRLSFSRGLDIIRDER